MTDLFDFQPKPAAFAVMGNPVAHSQSPLIHSLFARQFGISLSYDRIQVDVGGFEQAVSHFCAHGGAGLNITVPYKVEAWKLCGQGRHSLTPRADLAGAVNTLVMKKSGGIHGDNTDGAGLVADIRNNLGIPLDNKNLLVIGAGGAVRGVLGSLLECHPASITVVNRTFAKAGDLVGVFSGTVDGGDTALESRRLEDCDRPRYDLIINGTAASLCGELPGISESCIDAGTIVYDMVYSPEPTVFMKWALFRGAAQAHDGLGMLVEQAAGSFFVWHRKSPDTEPVIRAVRETLAGGMCLPVPTPQ